MEARFQAVSVRKDFSAVYHAQAFGFPEMPVIAGNSSKKIMFFRWGLIPAWVKDERKADEIKKYTLNARAETIFEKPSFESSIRSKRCLIPTTGYFEWQHINKEKIPYYIYLNDRELFSFAGIWSNYKNNSGNEVNTFSIITCEADEFNARIHNTKKRMPVILNEDEEELWINDKLKEDEIKFLLRKRSHNFIAHTISKSLGNPKVNSNVEGITEEVNYGTLNFGI